MIKSQYLQGLFCMKNPPLKIVMIARPNLFSVTGGDTIQVKETANALRQLGVEVDIIVNGDVNYSRYDLLHFFNVITPEDILGHIRRTNKPFVVSTIYVNYREYDRYHRGGTIGYLSRFLSRDGIEYVKTTGKFLLKGEKVSTPLFFIKGHRRSIQYILTRASFLLPNSENEYRRLVADYGISKPYRVIPNAINPELFKPTHHLERNIVLCVARIEGQKNQLNVIRALNGAPYRVVFIGAAAPNQLDYYRQCLEEAADNITFIDFIPQAQLLQYYNAARVHVLASWFETTGLSNLEAGAMRCQLVAGDRGDVRDYLGNEAFYCEPGNLASIRSAVDKAWNAEESSALSEKIRQNYIWPKTAAATLNAYLSVLNFSA